MEERKEQQLPAFDGIGVNPRDKKHAGKLAEAILERESEEELAASLKSQGLGTDEISKINAMLAPRRGQEGEAVDKRERAIERLRGAHACIMGLPEDKREWGDSFQRESGKGSWATKSEYIRGIERKDKREK